MNVKLKRNRKTLCLVALTALFVVTSVGLISLAHADSPVNVVAVELINGRVTLDTTPLINFTVDTVYSSDLPFTATADINGTASGDVIGVCPPNGVFADFSVQCNWTIPAVATDTYALTIYAYSEQGDTSYGPSLFKVGSALSGVCELEESGTYTLATDFSSSDLIAIDNGTHWLYPIMNNISDVTINGQGHWFNGTFVTTYAQNTQLSNVKAYGADISLTLSKNVNLQSTTAIDLSDSISVQYLTDCRNLTINRFGGGSQAVYTNVVDLTVSNSYLGSLTETDCSNVQIVNCSVLGDLTFTNSYVTFNATQIGDISTFPYLTSTVSNVSISNTQESHLSGTTITGGRFTANNLTIFGDSYVTTCDGIIPAYASLDKCWLSGSITNYIASISMTNCLLNDSFAPCYYTSTNSNDTITATSGSVLYGTTLTNDNFRISGACFLEGPLTVTDSAVTAGFAQIGDVTNSIFPSFTFTQSNVSLMETLQSYAGSVTISSGIVTANKIRFDGSNSYGNGLTSGRDWSSIIYPHVTLTDCSFTYASSSVTDTELTLMNCHFDNSSGDSSLTVTDSNLTLAGTTSGILASLTMTNSHSLDSVKTTTFTNFEIQESIYFYKIGANFVNCSLNSFGARTIDLWAGTTQISASRIGDSSITAQAESLSVLNSNISAPNNGITLTQCSGTWSDNRVNVGSLCATNCAPLTLNNWNISNGATVTNGIINMRRGTISGSLTLTNGGGSLSQCTINNGITATNIDLNISQCIISPSITLTNGACSIDSSTLYLYDRVNNVAGGLTATSLSQFSMTNSQILDFINSYISYGSNFVMSNCTIVGAPEEQYGGFVTTNVNGLSFLNNVVKDLPNYFLLDTSSLNVVIRGNDISNITGDASLGALTLNGEAGCQISRNKIHNCSLAIADCGIIDAPIFRNQIYNNSEGIRLSGFNGLACSGSIYLNFFNNSVNFDPLSVYTSTFWNASSAQGGGNYWATPAHDGASEIGTDANHDGFIDAPFILVGDDGYGNPTNIGVDFLPLASVLSFVNSGDNGFGGGWGNNDMNDDSIPSSAPHQEPFNIDVGTVLLIVVVGVGAFLVLKSGKKGRGR